MLVVKCINKLQQFFPSFFLFFLLGCAMCSANSFPRDHWISNIFFRVWRTRRRTAATDLCAPLGEDWPIFVLRLMFVLSLFLLFVFLSFFLLLVLFFFVAFRCSWRTRTTRSRALPFWFWTRRTTSFPFLLFQLVFFVLFGIFCVIAFWRAHFFVLFLKFRGIFIFIVWCRHCHRPKVPPLFLVWLWWREVLAAIGWHDRNSLCSEL